MLSDELLNVAPFLQPYVEAMEKAMRHIIHNSHLLQNSSSSQDLVKQVAMIFLASANITSDDVLSMVRGDFSGVNEASIINAMREAVKLMTDLKIFGDEPMVYQALEQFLASNDTTLILEKVAEMTAWLASTQASGLELLMQALPKVVDILRSILSLLTNMSADMPANTELFEGLAENIIAMLRQLLSTSGLLPPMSQHRGMYLTTMTGSNHTTRSRHRREAPFMPTRDPMDDFIDLFYIDYPAMFKAIAVPPTTGEILETVHMFLANPDLSVVLKGATGDMPWGLNASREETINSALGMLSLLTLPDAFQM